VSNKDRTAVQDRRQSDRQIDGRTAGMMAAGVYTVRETDETVMMMISRGGCVLLVSIGVWIQEIETNPLFRQSHHPATLPHDPRL